jgi:hypothetical protein
VVHPRHPIRCDLKGFPEIFYRGITYENSFSEKIKKKDEERGKKGGEGGKEGRRPSLICALV